MSLSYEIINIEISILMESIYFNIVTLILTIFTIYIIITIIIHIVIITMTVTIIKTRIE